MPKNWVFLNGSFFSEEQATIPITDRGFLFGEGSFTTIRIDQKRVELIQRHRNRLIQQGKELFFERKIDSFDWMQELIERNQVASETVRLKIIVTEKNFLAMVCPFQTIPFTSASLTLFPNLIVSVFSHLKTLSYLDHLYVRRYAKELNFDDAITCDGERFLMETGSANLFWIVDGKCFLPDFQLPYLKGVFLQALLPQLPFPHHFVKATIEHIPSQASLYMCNALTHIRPIQSIDNRPFPRNSHYETLLKKATIGAIEEDSILLS